MSSLLEIKFVDLGKIIAVILIFSSSLSARRLDEIRGQSYNRLVRSFLIFDAVGFSELKNVK